MMALYKAEKVNPASGCLPMFVQIPVFFSLYKVIFITIEMRHAPFFGWIHDLSAIDPTNVFNLFGLIPFDPAQFSPFLHLGVWPLIMGCTMYFQQKLNPPPPDPVQARMFQFMPVIFTFMLAQLPGRAGDLLDLEQPADDRAAMAHPAPDHASTSRGWRAPDDAGTAERSAPPGSRPGGCCSRRSAGSSTPPSRSTSCRRPACRNSPSPAGPTSANPRWSTR